MIKYAVTLWIKLVCSRYHYSSRYMQDERNFHEHVFDLQNQNPKSIYSNRLKKQHFKSLRTLNIVIRKISFLFLWKIYIYHNNFQMGIKQNILWMLSFQPG